MGGGGERPDFEHSPIIIHNAGGCIISLDVTFSVSSYVFIPPLICDMYYSLTVSTQHGSSIVCKCAGRQYCCTTRMK